MIEEDIPTEAEMVFERKIEEKLADGHINTIGVALFVAFIAHDLATLPENWYHDYIELTQLAGDSVGVLAIIVFTQEGCKAYFEAMKLFFQLHQLPERQARFRQSDEV